MTLPDSSSPQTGEARLRRRQRRTIAAMLVPGLVLVSVLWAARYIIEGPSGADPASYSPRFAIFFAVAITIGSIVAAVSHHRAIDEQDERAILWANTVGFYVATVSAMIADVFGMAGLAGGLQHTVVLIPAFALGVGTYCWLRFR